MTASNDCAVGGGPTEEELAAVLVAVGRRVAPSPRLGTAGVTTVTVGAATTGDATTTDATYGGAELRAWRRRRLSAVGQGPRPLAPSR
jgi:hypothetical protein